MIEYSKSSLMIDLDDPRTSEIADVITNKTSKKILVVLSQAEGLSESEICSKIDAPLNTVHYNVQKLVKAGLVEKSPKKMWSVKGKKIDYYRVSNKRIVISPKYLFKGVVPAIITSAIVAFFVKTKGIGKDVSNMLTKGASDQSFVALEKSVESAREIYSPYELTQEAISASSSDIALWFIAGAIFAMVIFLVWNWRRL